MMTFIGSVSPKEFLAFTSAVFMAGGIWRDIRVTNKTVKLHGAHLENDRDVLIKLTTEHNRNHGACIDVPRVDGK